MTTLKGLSGQPGGSRSAKWFRTILATAQIVLSVFLLAVAGLFTKSLFNVGRIDLGLQPDNVIAFGISPELNGYKPEQSRALFERIEDELAGAAWRHRRLGSACAGARGRQLGQQRLRAGLPGGPRHRHARELQRSWTRLLFDAWHAAPRRTRVHAIGSAGQPKVAIVNEQFAAKFNLGA